MSDRPDFIVEDDASRYLAENPSPGFDAEHAALLEAHRNARHPIYCSFCGKSSDQVICMIAGPTVFICDECVELAVAVVAMKKAENEAITIEQKP